MGRATVKHLIQAPWLLRCTPHQPPHLAFRAHNQGKHGPTQIGGRSTGFRRHEELLEGGHIGLRGDGGAGVQASAAALVLHLRTEGMDLGEK